jgi:hypothetical protein
MNSSDLRDLLTCPVCRDSRLSPLAAFVPWLRFPLDPHVLEAFWLEAEESP